jgi:hypothetical protein
MADGYEPVFTVKDFWDCPPAFKLALEDWEIFNRWNEALHQVRQTAALIRACLRTSQDTKN